MNEHCQNFNIGDVVVIRDWCEMTDEFGVDEVGRIQTASIASFTPSMRKLCGVICEVVDFELGCYRLQRIDAPKGNIFRFFFTDSMLKEYEYKDLEPNYEAFNFLSELVEQ